MVEEKRSVRRLQLAATTYTLTVWVDCLLLETLKTFFLR